MQKKNIRREEDRPEGADRMQWYQYEQDLEPESKNKPDKEKKGIAA